MSYLCDKVLSQLSDIKSVEEDDDTTVDMQLEMLKLLAEMSPHPGELADIEKSLTQIYDRLLVSNE